MRAPFKKSVVSKVSGCFFGGGVALYNSNKETFIRLKVPFLVKKNPQKVWECHMSSLAMEG